MSEIQELQGRIEKLEKHKAHPARFFFQFIFTPILLLVIGYFLNLNLEAAKAKFTEVELQLKSIEV